MFGTQSTTSNSRQDSRYQNTYEDSPAEHHQHSLLRVNHDDRPMDLTISPRPSLNHHDMRQIPLYAQSRAFNHPDYAQATIARCGPVTPPPQYLPQNRPTMTGAREVLSTSQPPATADYAAAVTSVPAASAVPLPPWPVPLQRDQLIHVSAAGGRGPYGASSYGPTTIQGAALGHETSAFYRNATYHRGIDSTAPPLVLKELPIEPFDGDIRRYPAFRDRFLDVVESQPDLAPRSKLLYLLQYLRGEPYRFASGMQLTDANYFIVVDRLEEQYGDKYRLRQLLAQDFVAMRPPAGGVADLHRFHDEAFRITMELRTLGENIDETVIYEQTLMAKLPPKLKEEIVRNSEYRRVKTVTSILDGLREYARLLDLVNNSGILFHPPAAARPDAPSQEQSSPPANSTSKCRSEELLATAEQPTTCATTVVATSVAQQPQGRRTCPFCSHPHVAADCGRYTTINQRLRRSQKLRLCLCCLSEGHRADSCPRRTKDSCALCGSEKHHRAVCRADANRARSRTLRRNSKCAKQGSTVDPKRSDPKRHSRNTLKERSVNREVTTAATTATKPRQPGTRRSPAKAADNPSSRKKRSKNAGTRSKGRGSTTRPTTTPTDESKKQKSVGANDGERLLPGHKALLPTDKCSQRRELRCFADQDPSRPLEERLHEDALLQIQRIEEDSSSLPSSIGHCYDYDSNAFSFSESERQPNERFPPHHCSTMATQASDDDSRLSSDDDLDPNWIPPFMEVPGCTAVAACDSRDAALLECVLVTAANPSNGCSRQVTVFFDSGSTDSYVSSSLARDLNLPINGKCIRRVRAFGSSVTTTVEGFSTSVLLRSPQGRQVSLDATTANHAIPPVRTALVEDADLPLLRRNERQLSSCQVTPHVLVGQDRIQLFMRQTGERLPNGFDVVHTILGPMIGGAGTVANADSKAVHISTMAAASATTDQHHQKSQERPDNASNGTLHQAVDQVPAPPSNQQSSTALAMASTALSESAPSHTDGNDDDISTVPAIEHAEAEEAHIAQSESEPSHTDGNDDDISAQQASTKADDHHCLQNELQGDATSTTLHARRCASPDSMKLSTSLQRKPNPLDTTARPLQTGQHTTSVVLQPGLRTGLRYSAQCDPQHDHRPSSSNQLPPALTIAKMFHTRKTRLRCRSSTQGRRELGIDQHELSRLLPLLQKTTIWLQLRQLVLNFNPPTHHHLLLCNSCACNYTSVLCTPVCFISTFTKLAATLCCKLSAKTPTSGLQDAFKPPGSRRERFSSIRSRQEDAATKPAAVKQVTNRSPGGELLPISTANFVNNFCPPPSSSRANFSALYAVPEAQPLSEISSEISTASSSCSAAIFLGFLSHGKISAPSSMSHASDDEFLEDSQAVYPILVDSEVDSERNIADSTPRAEAQHNRRSATPEPSHTDGGGSGAAEDEERAQNRFSETSEPSHNDGDERGAADGEEQAQNGSSETSEPSHTDGNESEAEPDDQPKTSRPRLRSPPSQADGHETESKLDNELSTSSSSDTSASPRSDNNQSEQHADDRPDTAIDNLARAILILCGRDMLERMHHHRELFLNISLKSNCSVIELQTSMLRYAARCVAVRIASHYAELPPDEILRALLNAIRANGHQSNIIITAPGLAYTSLVPVARADPLDQENNASRVVPPSASHLDHERDPASLPTPMARCEPSDAASFDVETSMASRTSDGAPPTAVQISVASCTSTDASALTIQTSTARRMSSEELALASQTAPDHHRRSKAAVHDPGLPEARRAHEVSPADQQTRVARRLTAEAAVDDSPSVSARRETCDASATEMQTHVARGLPSETAMGQAALLRDDAARILRTNREGSPLKNETVCFIDESTFRYFSRLLRPSVLMVATPMPSFVDALRSVLQFHLTDKVGRVIFWFSDCHVTFAGQMRLAVELSRHYATHYQDITQYVVATPSIGSRRDIWTCGLIKLLAQMRVTLPNARLVMCPRESRVTMQAAANGLKHHLRDHHQLDLWSRYDAARPLVARAMLATARSDASSLCEQSVDAKLPATSGTTKKASHRQRNANQPRKSPTRPRAFRMSKSRIGSEMPNKTTTNSKRPEPSHTDGKGADARKHRKERKERPSSGNHHRSRLTPAVSAKTPMPPTANTGHNNRRPPAYRKNGAHLPAAPLEDAASQELVRRSRICAFCTGPHWNTKCARYRTIGQRLRRIRKIGNCFVCLRTGHTAHTCPSQTLTTLCKFCKQRQHHRALCPVAWSTDNDEQPPPTHRKKGKHLPIVTQQAAASQVVVRRLRGCAFCEHPHYVAKCARYRTCAQRLRRARELGYCFICLRAGHTAHACPSRTKSPCQYCRQGQHHRALCPAVSSTTRAKQPGRSVHSTDAPSAAQMPQTQEPISKKPRKKRNTLPSRSSTRSALQRDSPIIESRPDTKISKKLRNHSRSVPHTDAPATARMSPPGNPIEAKHRRQPHKRKDRVPRK
ncbi:Zinc knuckle family protein [Aphelenchoides avenae]|nr:Zinc knuckle family protein [Aphelenchus avenae]